MGNEHVLQMVLVLPLGVGHQVDASIVHDLHVTLLGDEPFRKRTPVILDGIIQRCLTVLIDKVMIRAMSLQQVTGIQVPHTHRIIYRILPVRVNIINIDALVYEKLYHFQLPIPARVVHRCLFQEVFLLRIHTPLYKLSGHLNGYLLVSDVHGGKKECLLELIGVKDIPDI